MTYQSKLNKLKVLVTFALLLASSSSVSAFDHLSKGKPVLTLGLDTVLKGGKITQLGRTISRVSPKFTYAELLYQRLYGEDKFSVYGKSISETIKKSISQVKYRDEALEILGAEGWELSTTIIREISGGFEVFYYFKKKAE